MAEETSTAETKKKKNKHSRAENTTQQSTETTTQTQQSTEQELHKHSSGNTEHKYCRAQQQSRGNAAHPHTTEHREGVAKID